MKTSNKLLMFLVAAILIVPLLMITSFKNAIKNGHYVLQNIYGDNILPFKIAKPFKVIKLDGMNGQVLLNCTIKHGEQFSYKYFKSEENQNKNLDSSLINYSGDTLLIKYRLKNIHITENNAYYIGCNVEVTVPQNVIILANSANVFTNIDDRFIQNEKLDVYLSDNATFNINGIPEDSVSKQTNIIIPGISIHASHADIIINGKLHISKMEINLDSASSLTISKSALIDKLKGNVTGSTIINAPYEVFSAFNKN